MTNDRLQTFRNCHKKFQYYRIFAIRNFVLFAFCYLLLGIVCYLLCVIWYYMLKYMNNE